MLLTFVLLISYRFVRDYWFGVDIFTWLVILIMAIISYRERRLNLEYWIKGSEESSALDALAALNFHEIYRKDNHVLYKKKMRWTTNYYAILSKEAPLIKLKIAERFEKQVGEYIHNDQLFRPHVPTRRRLKETVSD